MSNKRFGYARVSTTDQNEDRQVLELLETGIEERDIYVDKQSGRSFERTNYLALRNTILRKGDVLVVKSIDRFGRNYTYVLSVLLDTLYCMMMVMPAGFEPSITSLRGLRPNQLDEGTRWRYGSDSNRRLTALQAVLFNLLSTVSWLG